MGILRQAEAIEWQTAVPVDGLTYGLHMHADTYTHVFWIFIFAFLQGDEKI